MVYLPTHICYESLKQLVAFHDPRVVYFKPYSISSVIHYMHKKMVSLTG